MSIREDIVTNIVTTLQEIVDLKPALVTREPFDVEKLAITQFPAILINSVNEERTTETMSAGIRQGTIAYTIRGFVRGNEIDKKRNDLVEAIEEALDADRNRGQSSSIIQDTQIASIEVIDRLPPLGEVVLTVNVRYVFTRGQA
jgi:glycine/serine hydroxymethyltransferase